MRYQGDTFVGVCPFHKDCIEGLVSNKAIAKRMELQIDEIPALSDSDPVWKIIGYYLA